MLLKHSYLLIYLKLTIGYFIYYQFIIIFPNNQVKKKKKYKGKKLD